MPRHFDFELIIDIADTTLLPEDREILTHPAVGGVILFTRNYVDKQQLKALTDSMHALRRERPLMICVDHEGGRVQRFRNGFTLLPTMRDIGKLYHEDTAAGLNKAYETGLIMARELQEMGIHLSFAPVLDIDAGVSEVIGDRSFDSDPDIIAKLATALLRGMHEAGLLAVGKHFPGHGHVAADSHTDVPVDARPLADIARCDFIPFAKLIQAGIDGIMPAHVIYAQVDPLPAGFSHDWLQDKLRGTLGFKGMIFSDDLCMAGAAVIGDIVVRAQKAIAAGCDKLLICNDRPQVLKVINAIDSGII